MSSPDEASEPHSASAEQPQDADTSDAEGRVRGDAECISPSEGDECHKSAEEDACQTEGRDSASAEVSVGETGGFPSGFRPSAGFADLAGSCLEECKVNPVFIPAVHDVQNPGTVRRSVDTSRYPGVLHVQADFSELDEDGLDDEGAVKHVFITGVYRDSLPKASIKKLDTLPELSSKQSTWACARWWSHWQQNAVRHRVYTVLTVPESSKAAFTVSAGIMLFIFLSTVCFCLDTVPHFQQEPHATRLGYVETITIAVFTLEYVLRLLSSPYPWRFMVRAMNVVDLVAILPYYLELIVASGIDAGNTRVLRVLRFARVTRMLRLGGKFQHLQVVLDALAASGDVLVMLLFLLLLLLVFNSSVLYFVESDVSGTLFTSIPASFWWAQVTLTTVGYGDMVPTTPLGQFLAGVLMCCSMIILALPISVIGANFTEQWKLYKAQERAWQRACGALSTFRGLCDALGRHQATVESLIAFLRMSQTETHAALQCILADAQESRALLLAQASVNMCDWEQEVMDLSDTTKRLRREVSSVKERCATLSAAFGVAALSELDRFHVRLQRAARSYKDLGKWHDEGLYMVSEVIQLRAELKQVEAALMQ